MRILIPDDYALACQGLDCLRKLQDHQLTILDDLSRDPSADAMLAEAECLLLIRERTQVDAEFLRRTPHLKVISQTGKLARNIDLDACAAAGVAVVDSIGSPHAPAELAWLLMMAARRQFVSNVNALYQGQWQGPMGRIMRGQTLGILGFGKIGKLVAGYAHAFGMRVMVWGSERARTEAQACGYEAAPSRQAFFASADILSLHLRLVEGTERSVTATDLARMKPDALLVNISRAELIEQGALEAALRAGHPGFAALDVFEAEPIYAVDHPLLQMPNVLCTPHMGYVERDSYELYLSSAIDKLLQVLAGDGSQVLNGVCPEAPRQ
ncbi:D-2-hydroxyacid dehydrogenase family protein [Chitinimonas arctica]|uniref:D-2-hydroxyacid dehydrogenase family protein n=1 Tax=Chitinimonas arctica TaxID=2594795 RepID=A0A516SHF5_9NEIS|nr:D-2-hydroxyacid dehydrogenase family protein [Chitinimonas arctica]QDQ27589.1 D-2-hydroxyacid dehydrogenase family protein [Chitinimonas arctica]